MTSGKPPSKKNKPQNKKLNPQAMDRHLVDDQPGKAIFITGFAISLLLGFTVSSLFSPGRVTSRLRDAASHINRDVAVEFESAEMSLRNGIFPRWSILINNVRMNSVQKCWGTPELTVDQIILPLSFKGLFFGEAPVAKVIANKAQLRFRGDFADCGEGSDKKASASTQEKAASSLQNMVRLQPSSSVPQREGDIKSLHINSFLITAAAMPKIKTELLNFKAKVVSTSPRIVEVTAQTHLLKNSQVGDYLSHANLFLEYRESPSAQVRSHFFGNWREGHYSLVANYNLDEELLSVESDLRHIPLSQILEVLKRYELTSADLDPRQIWISGQANFVSTVNDLKKSPLQVRDFKLEGELGELSVEKFQVLSIEPFRHEPLNVSIRGLKVENLLALLKRTQVSPVFGNLGQFSGRAQIVSENEMTMTGEHKGLEFLFSNKGQREAQIFTSLVGDVTLRGNSWDFQISRAQPENGTMVGGVQIKADRDFKDVAISTQVEELSFDPKIQRLMTNGGDFGPLSLEAKASLNQGTLKNVKGLLQVSQMNVEGLFAFKSRFEFNLVPDALAFQYSNRNMVIDPQSPVMTLLRDVIQGVGFESTKPLKVDKFRGDFKLQKNQELAWLKTQGRLEGTSTFTTDGGWSPLGVLKGQLQIQERGRQRRWTIEGTRDLPLLTSKDAVPLKQ